MNATETEMRIANDMVEFLEEYVRQKRCNSMEVTVLFMARMPACMERGGQRSGLQTIARARPKPEACTFPTP